MSILNNKVKNTIIFEADIKRLPRKLDISSIYIPRRKA